MGRPKAIESPEKMWELFLEYKEQTKASPILVQDFVGKDGEEVNRKKERPLTMEGFENYVFMQDLATDLDQYFANREGRYDDYVSICTRIRRMIREDQIQGGMAGIYNPSITQRLNNLVEKVQEDGKKEMTIKVKYERAGHKPE